MVINSAITWFYLQVFYMGMFRPDSAAAKLAEIGKEGEIIANRVYFEYPRDS